MTKLFSFAGATLGSYLGWWAGARAGTMTAFILSTVLAGAGMYAGRLWAVRILD